jgi:hypothetical protein
LEPERRSDTRLELRGGCQCGSVRYVALVDDDEAYYCHCHMCQKAFGNLFGAFFLAFRQSVRWEGGEPAFFRSSKIARRGFCRECGTPLSFEYLGSEEIHLTVGSLDEPGSLRIREPRGNVLHRRRAAAFAHRGRRGVRREVEGCPWRGLYAWPAGRPGYLTPLGENMGGSQRLRPV